MSTIRVSFKDRESRAKATWLILFSKEESFSRVTTSKPPRDLIMDVRALKVIDKAGIKMYPPTLDGEKPSYDKPLNVAEFLVERGYPID